MRQNNEPKANSNYLYKFLNPLCPYSYCICKLSADISRDLCKCQQMRKKAEDWIAYTKVAQLSQSCEYLGAELTPYEYNYRYISEDRIKEAEVDLEIHKIYKASKDRH